MVFPEPPRTCGLRYALTLTAAAAALLIVTIARACR